MDEIKKLLEAVYYSIFTVVGISSIPWLFSSGAKRHPFTPTVTAYGGVATNGATKTYASATTPSWVHQLNGSWLAGLIILAALAIAVLIAYNQLRASAFAREAGLSKMISFYGWERYLQKLNARVICADKYGTLYLKRYFTGENLAILAVKNSTAEPDGTFKTYYLRVPPEIRSSREAVAWTFSIESEKYDPARET